MIPIAHKGREGLQRRWGNETIWSDAHWSDADGNSTNSYFVLCPPSLCEWKWSYFMILSFFPFFWAHWCTNKFSSARCHIPLILHLEEIFCNHPSLYNLSYLLFVMCCTVWLCHKQFTGILFIALQLIDICVRGKKKGKFLHAPGKKPEDKSQAINLGVLLENAVRNLPACLHFAVRTEIFAHWSHYSHCFQWCRVKY